ncbi:unnamed protein product [Brachionus calyciflorus]|uniref:Uncharacterized protein n=1 Tax=Brachionus calyciflorus TaxID=104777 RepID=A0A813YYT2_9BILA|nr:unnamed protein product [Brachionus calyciflorus]
MTSSSTLTTTFKVVEIYRNNSSSSLLNPTVQVTDDLNENRSTQIYNLLGFNLIGGYSTDLPITIVDILNQNGKTPKVEEGDIILEINGISTRHMTLNEVNKQLRCCGNRIYLKIKSDPDYKSKLSELLKQTENLSIQTNILSKSCDNYINSSSSSSSSFLLHSNTIQNLSSTTLDNSISVSSSILATKSSDKSLTDTLTLTNDTKDDLIDHSTSSTSPLSSNDSSDCLSETTTSEHVYDNQIINAKMPTDLLPNNLNCAGNSTSPVLAFQVEIDEFVKQKIDEKLKECEIGDSDSDSEVPVYTPKGVDLPSAQRLAKRLYYLDGFKSSDVVRHLSKKNDFSSLVAEEYLRLFNFQSLTLDAALRKFLKQFQLVGDAQEKERVLMYFAKRYVDANNTAFNDVDSCHTLTCAIMLLNTDLHDPKVQNKMSLNEFIENLKGLNNGFNFPDVLLESLYSAIKNEPLEFACLDNDDICYDENPSMGISNPLNGNYTLRPLGSNPFIQMPDPQSAKEYKYGWLLRKCCIDSDGKRSPFLKRSWKMFYASLRDMVLYLHKDDKVFKNNTFDNITNAIRIHHSYASVASDYKKKQFVFRLKTADWAEYLFQTANSNELYDWVSTINSIAAMFSSPPLPGAIGSNKSFQRPLLPVSKTRYTLQEQLEYHKKHLKQLKTDLSRLESGAFNQQNFDKDKYNYLQYEIQRYQVYSSVLEEKILSESQSVQSPKPVVINEFSNSSGIFVNGGLMNGGLNFSDTTHTSPVKQMHLNSSPSVSPSNATTNSTTLTPTNVNSKKFNNYLD